MKKYTKAAFGDTVHIESINKTGLVVGVDEDSLVVVYLVRFPDNTVGHFSDVELVGESK